MDARESKEESDERLLSSGLAARPSRRRFLLAAGGLVGAGLLAPSTAGIASAEPRWDDYEWVANHVETRLMGADGQPVAWLTRWTRLRILRGLPNGWLEVWVPRLSLVGRVPVSTIGRVHTPSPEQLAQEKAELTGPATVASVGLPGRVVGGGNFRLWPAVRPDTLLRPLGHNASVRVLSSVEGDDGEEWYRVSLLSHTSNEPVGEGYLHGSLVRLPRITTRYQSPDRNDHAVRYFEADLKEPALLMAYDNGAPVWATLTIKGTAADRTSTGAHKILRQVPNETMSSETLRPPIPRDAPGGYYLKNVLYTQYFTWDGQSIHYNYWSSNWGYPGSHGCLGVPLAEARWAWDFAEVGSRIRIFA